jgi:hypothetical protein
LLEKEDGTFIEKWDLFKKRIEKACLDPYYSIDEHERLCKRCNSISISASNEWQ